MTILYADDDHEDQEVFAEIVHAINPAITILRAENGLKTIELLADSHPPDIIFLDINMPFLNGYEALERIRSNDKLKNTRVIMYSTNMYQKTYDEYAHLNAKYLTKPNTIQEGIETLKTIIRMENPNVSFT